MEMLIVNEILIISYILLNLGKGSKEKSIFRILVVTIGFSLCPLLDHLFSIVVQWMFYLSLLIIEGIRYNRKYSK